ncbi:hypothetical protein ANTPLA_LOCUS6901 [Anthophora plagiata]
MQLSNVSTPLEQLTQLTQLYEKHAISNILTTLITVSLYQTHRHFRVTMVSGYAIKGAGKRIRFQSNDHRPSVHSISSVRKPLSTREEWSSSGDRPARAGNLFILLFLAI